MSRKISRRAVIGSAAGAAAATFPLPWISPMPAWAADPILLGLPIAQTAKAGVADHADHLNGATLAMEEINGAGGVLGRQIKPIGVDIDVLSPEGCQASVRKVVDSKV